MNEKVRPPIPKFEPFICKIHGPKNTDEVYYVYRKNRDYWYRKCKECQLKCVNDLYRRNKEEGIPKKQSKESLRRAESKRNHKNVKALTDAYIKTLLKKSSPNLGPRSSIPQSLIKLKRATVLLKRELNKSK